MQPIFRVVLLAGSGGAKQATDLTPLLADRLLTLRITDKAGLDSDELDISLDDRDGAVRLPDTGAVLEVSLGYAETGLTRIGQYRIDEVGSSGMPQTVTLRGRPANMLGAIRQARRHAWSNCPLEQIVRDIAQRNKLKPVCKVKATVVRADQMNESDLHFLTRLARQYDATATIKGGQVLVLPRGGQRNSRSGKPLPTLVLQRRDISHWQFLRSDREAAGGAAVRSHDQRSGKTQVVMVPDKNNPDSPPRYIRHPVASKGGASAAAKATANRARRAEFTLNLSLPGRPDIVAERTLRAQGIKEGVDGLWTVDSVVHNLSRSGWDTALTLVINKKTPHKAGRKVKKTKQPGVVLTPTPL